MSQSTTLPANITIGVDLGDKVSQTYVVDAEGRCQDQAPVRHRSEQAPQDLALLKARDQVVKLRTDTINHVRGTVKALGHRLPRCSAEASSRVAEHVPDAVAGAVPAAPPADRDLHGADPRLRPASSSRRAGGRMRRSAPWSRWRGSWPCCGTISGSRRRPMIRRTTSGAPPPNVTASPSPHHRHAEPVTLGARRWRLRSVR